jgi:hypothetical protein
MPRNKTLAATGGPCGAQRATSGPASRAGKLPVAGFFDPAVRRAIKLLAIERACSQQEILTQALRMLFEDAVERGSSAVRAMPCGLGAEAQDGEGEGKGGGVDSRHPGA